MTAKNKCIVCGKELHGRADKKFCNDYCRNSYNNSEKRAANNFVRKIDAILKKNRRILEDVLKNQNTKTISKAKLTELEFQFKYFTHSHKTKKGDLYKFCYEFGYLEIENNFVLVVQQSE